MEEIKQINVDGVDYDIVGKELTKITYAELKALRDTGELSEGHLYRITDYVTTTTETNTKSAGNVFDVIVLAVSANELSHIARAIQHEGDTYFDGNDLGAWELWYDLDNDTKKYNWADATNGKGVIYRMIDDKQNDCPYDFKNMLFYNTKIAYPTTGDQYYYTFSYVVSGNLFDGTVAKQVTTCHSNSMRMYFYGKKMLNKNVFRNEAFDHLCYSNTFGANCYSNTFKDKCNHNTFRSSCDSNTFGNNCRYNTFGNNCYGNTFGSSCDSNTFGSSCDSNTFGNNCRYNTFDGTCGSNTLGDSCNYNTFSNNCRYNTFDGTCGSNTLSDSCNYNIFGSICNHNTLGSACSNNTFGYSCNYNTLGNHCDDIHVDGNKTSITFNDEYYDDGRGQLVPIKHPDLSTQPSILPYKFMGQYVYEQLIPMDVWNNWDWFSDRYPVKNPLFLEAWGIGYKESNGKKAYLCLPASIQPRSIAESESSYNSYNFVPYYTEATDIFLYIRVVYTSMPEEGGYYGYNNY